MPFQDAFLLTKIEIKKRNSSYKPGYVAAFLKRLMFTTRLKLCFNN